MTRLIAIYIIFLIAFTACSKEEDIPFLKEERDTITPTSYSDLSGKYQGILANIEIIADSTYRILSSQTHSITIDQIDFSTIMINNITNIDRVNVETYISREIGGVFLQMDESKLPETVGTIPAFYVGQMEYNGIYSFQNPREVEYFIYITDMVDTVQQVFNGNFIE